MNEQKNRISLATTLCCVASITHAAASPFSVDWLIAKPHYLSLGITNHGTLTDVMLPLQMTNQSLWYGSLQTRTLYTQLGSLISVGSGYRYLMAPQWMLSGYLYWDGAKLPNDLGLYSKLNPGFEVQSIIGGVTVNAYFPIMLPGADPSQLQHQRRRYFQKHQERETQYLDPNHWALDSQLAFVLLPKLKALVGGYYMPQTEQWANSRRSTDSVRSQTHDRTGSTVSTVPDLQSKQEKIQNVNVLGGAIGVEYAINPMFNISFKYSYDAFQGHHTTLSMRFEHRTPQMGRTFTPLLWQPTSRYVGPIAINKERVIRDNIYFAKAGASIEEEVNTSAHIGNGTYEKPVVLNAPQILNTLTEKAKSNKLPSYIYIASDSDDEGNRIPANINVSHLYANQSLYGRNADFSVLKPNQIHARPLLAGVLKLPEGENVVSDVTFCPDLAGQHQYHIVGDEMRQQETSLAIGHQDSKVENVYIENVNVTDIVNSGLSGSNKFPVTGDASNGVKRVASALYYDTNAAISGANHIIFNNWVSDFARMGLAIEDGEDISIYNSNIGAKGSGSVMQGIYTKGVHKLHIKNSTIEGSEYVLNATAGSDIELYSCKQRLFSDRICKAAAPLHILDSSVLTMDNNNELYVSAKNADEIAAAIIEKTPVADNDQQVVQHKTSLTASYTKIHYIIHSAFNITHPKLFRLLSKGPVDHISISDCKFYSQGYALSPVPKDLFEQRGWIYKNNKDQSYSVKKQRQSLGRKRSNPALAAKSPRLLSPKSPRQVLRKTPVSPKPIVVPEMVQSKLLSNVSSLIAQYNWNDLSEAQKNETIFRLLPLQDQKKAVDNSQLSPEQKIAARYYLIFETSGTTLPAPDNAQLLKKDFLYGDPRNPDHVARRYEADIKLKNAMYGPASQADKLGFIQSLQFPRKVQGQKSFDDYFSREVFEFESCAKLVKELEATNPASIQKEKLLAGLNLAQFNLEQLIDANRIESEIKRVSKRHSAARASKPKRKSLPHSLIPGAKRENDPERNLKGLAINAEGDATIIETHATSSQPAAVVPQPLLNGGQPVGLPAHPAAFKSEFTPPKQEKGRGRFPIATPIKKKQPIRIPPQSKAGAELAATFKTEQPKEQQFSPKELDVKLEKLPNDFTEAFRKIEEGNEVELTDAEWRAFHHGVTNPEYTELVRRMSYKEDPKRPRMLMLRRSELPASPAEQSQSINDVSSTTRHEQDAKSTTGQSVTTNTSYSTQESQTRPVFMKTAKDVQKGFISPPPYSEATSKVNLQVPSNPDRINDILRRSKQRPDVQHDWEFPGDSINSSRQQNGALPRKNTEDPLRGTNRRHSGKVGDRKAPPKPVVPKVILPDDFDLSSEFSKHKERPPYPASPSDNNRSLRQKQQRKGEPGNPPYPKSPNLSQSNKMPNAKDNS